MDRFDVIDDNCERIKCDMQAADKLLKEKVSSVLTSIIKLPDLEYIEPKLEHPKNIK